MGVDRTLYTTISMDTDTNLKIALFWTPEGKCCRGDLKKHGGEQQSKKGRRWGGVGSLAAG